MPPLRERREDIPLLASHFAALHAAHLKRPPPAISRAALACLCGYDWPGNVRELANYIERAVVLGRGETLHVEDLPAALSQAPRDEAGGSLYASALTRLKRKLIIDAVRTEGGNVSAAARRLGLHPNYLHRLIRKLDLRTSLR